MLVDEEFDQLMENMRSISKNGTPTQYVSDGREVIETNQAGGKQSKITGRFDLIDQGALRQLANVLAEGEVMYGRDNWRKISAVSHINHALQHINWYLESLQGRGVLDDMDEEDLTHAFTRLMMAVAQDAKGLITDDELATPTFPVGRSFDDDQRVVGQVPPDRGSDTKVEEQLRYLCYSPRCKMFPAYHTHPGPGVSCDERLAHTLSSAAASCRCYSCRPDLWGV